MQSQILCNEITLVHMHYHYRLLVLQPPFSKPPLGKVSKVKNFFRHHSELLQNVNTKWRLSKKQRVFGHMPNCIFSSCGVTSQTWHIAGSLRNYLYIIHVYEYSYICIQGARIQPEQSSGNYWVGKSLQKVHIKSPIFIGFPFIC